MTQKPLKAFLDEKETNLLRIIESYYVLYRDGRCHSTTRREDQMFSVFSYISNDASNNGQENQYRILLGSIYSPTSDSSLASKIPSGQRHHSRTEFLLRTPSFHCLSKPITLIPKRVFTNVTARLTPTQLRADYCLLLMAKRVKCVIPFSAC